MAENPEVENHDRYKSYIQRRRVVPENTEYNSVNGYDSISEYDSVNEDTSATGNISETETRTKTEKSAITDVEELSLLREKYRPDEGTEEKSTYIPFKLFAPKTKNTHKTDTNIYRKYPSSYPQTHFNASAQLIAPRQYTSGSFTSRQTNRAPIEDNRTTLLAIKIIKQALACFALLGIVVLMQQNADLADELSFVRKHVVDNHIEISNIITGVENIIAECSRLFGGSP